MTKTLSAETEFVLEGLVINLRYEAFAKRFLKDLKKRKADREAEDVKAAVLDECAAKVEAILGRVVPEAVWSNAERRGQAAWHQLSQHEATQA